MTKSITSLGGVQRVVIQLANSLSKYHDVTILSDDNSNKIPIFDISSNVQRENVNNVNDNFFNFNLISKVIKKINRNIGILNNKFFRIINENLHYKKNNRNKLINYINENSFDIVIGAQGDISMYLALISSKINAKTIGWNHSTFNSYYYLKGFYYYGQSYLFKINLKKLDEIVVLSDYDKECFRSKWGIDVNVITNMKTFTSKIKSSLESNTFIAVGRFTYVKGFDILIEAFNIFNKENKGYKLLIIGDGELENVYRSLINKYELNNSIHIITNTVDIKPYLLNSCGLIMPSRWEGLGMVMIESFEMGVPVIAFDLPSIKDYLISNYTGLKCNNINCNDLSRTIKNYTMLNLKLMQSNCIKITNLFSEEHVLSKWNVLLEKCCK